MSNVPLVRRAIAGATLANTSTSSDALSLNPEGNNWSPAALERSGSTLKALNRMAKRPPVNILFEDVGRSVSTSNGERRILHNVSGEFRSGELACILGPSGAGKSTLLNILAGYKSTGFNGRISVNDQARDMRVFKKLSSYIMQDDMLQPRLTVNESLMIAADLKLGSELGKAEKILVVEEILQTLGLWNQRNTMSHDLSGGQSKRLSVALELVNNPPVIILDEPTTGLDIVSIRQLVVLLRLLSRQGRTIICTIHQPSASLFSLFDQVYVLARGLCCYQINATKIILSTILLVVKKAVDVFYSQTKSDGLRVNLLNLIKGAAALLVPYLAEIGHVCPKTHNPADFVLETLVSDTETAAQMSELCQNGKLCRKLNRMTAREGRKPVLLSDESIQRIFTDHVAKEQLQKMDFATTFITQFLILIKRMFLQMRRNSISLWIQLLHHMSAALLLGGVFFLIGNDANAPIANFKFCLSCVVFFMYTHIMIPVLLFPIELRMLRREYFNRWYSLKAYYAALTLSTIPLMIILGTLFTIICYTMSGQLLEFDRFLLFTITGLMTGICSEGFGLLVGSTFSSTNGSIVGPATVAPLLALCCYGLGFGPYIENIMKILMSMSYLRYALSGFCLALYQKRPIMDCNVDFCLYADTKILLRDIGMSNDTYITQIIGLLLFTILHRTAAYFALRYRLTQEFTNKFMTYISKFLKHR